MKNTNEKLYTYSRRQRILAWIALVGIFICGMMAGAFIWQTKTVHTADAGVQNNFMHVNEHESTGLAEAIKQAVERNTMPCLDKETELQKMLTEDDHLQNARVYEKLSQIGCEMNREKYENFAKSERELDDAMRYVRYSDYVDTANNENVRPCETIEKTLLSMANPNCWENSTCHSENAAIYSKITEDGCPENAEKYRQMALNELQIADGIKVRDDNVSHDEMRYTVDAYKKLQMQNEAKKYLNKVEKMVNPGIDFILELQRIIEE